MTRTGNVISLTIILLRDNRKCKKKNEIRYVSEMLYIWQKV